MNDATLAKAMCFSCTAVPFPGKIKTLKCGVYFWKEWVWCTYSCSVRMNPYSHLFWDALSGPNTVVQKHLPRLLLKCCHSSFPAGPLVPTGGHFPSKEIMDPSAKITHYHTEKHTAKYRCACQNRHFIARKKTEMLPFRHKVVSACKARK